ncbi:MAG: hypothetical protein K0S79_1692, partial [Nitrospira sp.]|nr:hypothetical protein [Nitrospira sp.]
MGGTSKRLHTTKTLGRLLLVQTDPKDRLTLGIPISLFRIEDGHPQESWLRSLTYRLQR